MTTDTLAKLAACPFCGDEPKTTERPDNIDGTEFFYAVMCYCGGYSATAHKMAIRKTPEQAKADAVEAWNRRALTAQALPAAEPFGYFKAEPFGWVNCAETDDGAVALYERPASQFTGAFTGIAARKLAELADQGYRVNGYSLMHAETRARGFIDDGGFVGWWSNRDHEQAATPKAALVAEFGERMAGYSEGFDDGKGVGERQAAQATAGVYLQVYRCKIKSRSQIKKEIPREHQGWWADVSAGQVLNLRQAVQADLDRCNLSGPRSRNPDDYMCETFAHGSLVSKVALEYMNPEQHVFAIVAALPQPQPQSAQSKGDA